MNNDKRNEWLDLMARYPSGIDPAVFLKNARRKDSAFHHDFEWDERAAAKRYYEKRAANLVVHYSTIFNTVTADQRLHLVRPMAFREKGILRKVAKTVAMMDEDELSQGKAMVWQRLRRIVRDLHDFSEYVPEFKELFKILQPRVVVSEVVHETVQRGAAAH